MSELMRIRDGVEVPLTEDFLSADEPSRIGSVDGARALESFQAGTDTTALDALTERIMSEYQHYDAAMDRAMAIELHHSLPLSRRQASDRNFWAWLGAVHAPDFVAWRWKPSDSTGLRSRERFLGDRVRQAHARLWWAVELTRDGENYELTERLFALPGFQDIYEGVFGRAFCGYRPAVAAFVEMVGDRQEAFIRAFARELGHILTTSLLESMDEVRVKAVMRELVQRMDDRAA